MTALRVRVPLASHGLALALQAACKAASLARGSHGDAREASRGGVTRTLWFDAWSDRNGSFSRGLVFLQRTSLWSV